MAGLDELLSFPSRSEQYGGSIDGEFNIFTREDVAKKTVDIHTTPIIMTGKAPAIPTIDKLSVFAGGTGLDVNEVLGINGEAVRKILTDTSPDAVFKGISDKLFLITPPQTYEKISELLPKQVGFICIFHHLFFLAKLADFPSFPMFSASFSEKFNAIQLKYKEEPKKTESIFGEKFADITKFWDTVVNDLPISPKLTLSQILEQIESEPKKIYEWLIGTSPTVPGAAPSVAPATATPAAPAASASISTAPGAASITTSNGFAPISITSGSQPSKASVAPKKILPTGTGLSPQVEKVVEDKFAASGRPGASTAAAIAAATGRPQRAAAAASQASTAKLAASLKPRTSAAASKHVATNQNKEPTDEERKQAETIEKQENAKKDAARKAAVTTVATNGETHPSKEEFTPLPHNTPSIKESNKEENSNNNSNNANSLTTQTSK